MTAKMRAGRLRRICGSSNDCRLLLLVLLPQPKLLPNLVCCHRMKSQRAAFQLSTRERRAISCLPFGTAASSSCGLAAAKGRCFRCSDFGTSGILLLETRGIRKSRKEKESKARMKCLSQCFIRRFSFFSFSHFWIGSTSIYFEPLFPSHFTVTPP